MPGPCCPGLHPCPFWLETGVSHWRPESETSTLSVFFECWQLSKSPWKLWDIARSQSERTTYPQHTAKIYFWRIEKELFIWTFYLVIYKEDSILDRKLLKKQVKAYRNFSFASHAELKTIMKVNFVTPFSLVYLSTANVQIVVAKSLLQETSINFHPLDGRFTTRISFDDLELFLKSLGRYRDVKFVDIWDLLK